MGETEPENQVICWDQQKRGHDANLDSDVYLFADRLHQIPIEIEEEHAADIAVVTGQLVRKA